MDEDPEINAMSAIASALAPLPEDAAARVLAWANTRFGGAVVTQSPSTSIAAAPAPAPASAPQALGSAAAEFRDVGDLMAEAAPTTGNARVLVACYWFNVVEEQEVVTSAQVHDELKHLGYPVANITKSFSDLSKSKPGLVQQVRKTGTSAQARKLYRITRAGMSRVDEMIRENRSEA